MKSSLLIATLLAVPLLSWAQDVVPPVTPTPPAAPSPVTPPPPPASPDAPAPGARAAAFRQQVLEKFDADKDGKLSDSERETAKTAWKDKTGDLHAKALEKFDEDKDGQLSETERAALRMALKARREGKGGDGEKAEARDAERQRKMLEKFDEDKDGQLNEAERAKARAARRARPAAVTS